MSLSVYNNGVSSAEVPSGVLYWPVPGRSKVVSRQGGRAFGAARGNVYQKVSGTKTLVATGARYHAGIDLYGSYRDVIVAPEQVEVVNFYHFYRGTYALFVRTSSQVLNIGEVDESSLAYFGHKTPALRLRGRRTLTTVSGDTHPLLGVGSVIEAGEPLAIVGKMHRSSMLHFEVYTIDTITNRRWYRTAALPSELRDPTPYLEACKTGGTTRDTADVASRTAVESTSVNPRVRTCSD